MHWSDCILTLTQGVAVLAVGSLLLMETKIASKISTAKISHPTGQGVHDHCRQTPCAAGSSILSLLTCTFSPVPATPVKLLMPLRPTAAAICLHARLMELITVASSVSMWPWRSCCGWERKNRQRW